MFIDDTPIIIALVIDLNLLQLQNNTHIIYQNAIRHNIPSVFNGVTRSSAYLIDVTCELSRDGFPNRNVEPRGQPAPPAVGTGEFQITLDLYRSNSFTSPIRVSCIFNFLYYVKILWTLGQLSLLTEEGIYAF